MLLLFMMLEGFDPVHFTSVKDIERQFGKSAVLGYIKNLKNILLDRTNLDNLSSGLSDQLADFVKTPDKGSDFEEKLKNIPQDLSNKDLIKGLLMMGYGIHAKILPENDKMVSFIAYQEDTNNNILKIFKLHTDEEYRGGKITYDLVQGLLEQKDKDIQVGKGPLETNQPNGASKKMIELYKSNGYTIDEERFIIKNNNFNN